MNSFHDRALMIMRPMRFVCTNSGVRAEITIDHGPLDRATKRYNVSSEDVLDQMAQRQVVSSTMKQALVISFNEICQ